LEQDSIGWYSFLLGRLSTRWSDAQQRYTESISKRNSGRRWTIAILKKVWDISWDMWEQRNGIVYETLHPCRLTQLHALQQAVRDRFHEGCDKLLPRDQRLFAKGLNTLLKGSDCEMNQWMVSVLLAQQRSASAREDYEASLPSERALMQSWLHPVPGSEQDTDTTLGHMGAGP
jgi:hypothetical protein